MIEKWSKETLQCIAAQVWDDSQTSGEIERWEKLHQEDRERQERRERNARMNNAQLARSYA